MTRNIVDNDPCSSCGDVNCYDYACEDPFAGLLTADEQRMVEANRPVRTVHVTEDQMAAEVREHYSARKYTDADVTAAHKAFVTGWLAGYTGDFDFLVDMKARRNLSTAQIRGVLNCYRADVLRNAKSDTDKATGRPAQQVTDGFWVVRSGDNVDVFKVQVAVHGSGNLYAKLLDKTTGQFDYVGRGPLRTIAVRGEKLTLELAKELGQLYGRCCVCGRTLTNEESIEAGIGPVCAGRL